MKIFSKTLFAFVMLALAGVYSYGADTLEVYAIRVQFAKESTKDNSLTTGDGTFGSDKEHSYRLDPSGMRGSTHYWKKHFEFANNYFNAASNGQLVIKSRIFPLEGTAYTLKTPMIDYNRTSKQKGEKTAEFDEARSRDYLKFVYDAVMAADTARNMGESPFRIPLPESSNTKRAFMIIHAGASRLVDGGSMGTKGADTPGDFMDVYIDQSAWEYLPDTLENISTVNDTLKDSKGKDSIYTKGSGIVLKGSAIDTLHSIMITSETASQDGLNWGINGIIVNQIARELGLPNTYDVVKGISRLGYYDMMDFAGYNAGNGFLPSLPAAWDRAYMGWSSVVEARPVAGKEITIDIAAAGSGKCATYSGKNICTEILKVPLNATEYLLIENRQRSWDDDGMVSVTTDEGVEEMDTTISTFTVDSVGTIFEDTLCVKKKCSANKIGGVVLDVSSYDAGLPASGIVTWKVNEWFLRETLEYGIANFWGGDDFRDHQFGIAMVESDGVLSIGKTFKNALGEDTYDYGSGTDLLPHLRVPDSTSKQSFDTVKTIEPTGYANTMTTQGGYTGIKITVSVPEDARIEKTSNAFMGDSVINFAAPIITVKISIDDGSLKNSKFPRNVGLVSAVRGAVFIADPENEGEKAIVIGAEDGSLQAFSALGEPLLPEDTVVSQKVLTLKDSSVDVPLYRVGESDGPLVGMASEGKSVYSLHKNALVRTSFLGGVAQKQELKLSNALVGPVYFDEKVWVATKTALKSARVNKSDDFVWTADSIVFAKELEKGTLDKFKPTDMAICGKGDNARIVTVGESGHWMVRPVADMAKKVLVQRSSAADPVFKMACVDMDRDGSEEVVFVGSRGSVFTKTLAGEEDDLKSLWNLKNYKRGATGTSGLKDETSGVAVGDINDDGYPEVVFLGDNLIYALDRFGLPLKNFPIVISRGSPIYAFYSDPLVVDVTGDNVPEILVPSNDGLVYAFDSKGAQIKKNGFPIAAGSHVDVDSVPELVPMSIFVTNAVADTKSNGPEIYAIHRNSLSAFRLQKAKSDASESALAWTLPAGGNERTGWFDASELKDVESVKSENTITEFFMFPNPVRGGKAKAQFEIGADAQSATFEVYDVTGLCVYKTTISDVVRGRNRIEHLDLSALGSDVYTARLQVKFADGKKKQKLYRFGLIR
ncbi:MAG: hypothetical protein MJY85_00290 [Fibrobacter sp.]|nr:hypothetical protein [Fibrobacter sp.]